MKKSTTSTIFLIFFSLFISAQCSISSNLVVNGDFELGFSDFTSDYGYSPGDLVPEGKFDVISDPNLSHSNFASCADNSSGSGNMMVVNGAGTAGERIWCQTVAVDQSKEYSFSAHVTSVHPTSPAIFQFSINGVSLGSSYNAPTTTCSWNQFCETWNSGLNSSAEICIVNQNTAAAGNDFAIDDIKMGELMDVLPVELGDFKVTSDDGEVKVYWFVYEEIDHDRYEIERSVDGENWDLIGSQNGEMEYGNSKSYEFNDHVSIAGTYYYRLKMVSNFGEVEYSDVRAISHEVASTSIKAYPNPMIDQFCVNINENEFIEDLMVLDPMGKVLYYEKKMDEVKCISLPGLNPGSYFLQFKTNEDELHRTILVKQ